MVTWKTFDRKTVFLSFSRDMLAEANVVREVISELNRGLPAGDDLSIFHWPSSDTVWSADGTWQQHIPRTSDANCHLLICLFGERVGEPLPGYFPFPSDVYLPSWASLPGTHATTGKIPVTGTLFEYLDRIHGSSPPGRTLCYFRANSQRLMNRHVSDVADRNYGFGHHFDDIKNDRKRPTRSEEAEYDEQIDKLDLFVGVEFRDSSRPFRCFGDDTSTIAECLDDLRKLLRRDLGNTFGIHADSRTFEPKGLAAYSPADADFLFGRDKTIVRVLETLDALDKNPSQLPIVALAGRSGEGKSSILQAGLIGRLAKGRYSDFGAFSALCIEAYAFVGADPLVVFAEHLERHFGPPLLEGSHHLTDFAVHRRPDLLHRAIRRALENGRDSGKKKLFIGLDQVEELLFASEQDSAYAATLAVVWDVLERLSFDRLAHVVLTLPNDQLDRLAIVAPALSKSHVSIGALGEEDIREIIQGTLGRSKLPTIQNKLDGILRATIIWLSSQKDPGPVLPFLSVFMREWAEAEKPRGDKSSEPPLFETVLGRLGEKALKDAFDDSWQQARTSFDRFMRQLVVTGRVGGEWVTMLRNAPSNQSAFTEAPNLVRAMKQQRLLYSPTPDSLRLVHVSIVDEWEHARKWHETDLENHRTLTEIEPKAERWRQAASKDRPSRLVNDPHDLDRIENLWTAWKSDSNLLPIDFMRACLLQAVSRFQQDGHFARSEGGSRFSIALAITDNRLTDCWFTALDALPRKQRRRIATYKHSQNGRTALFLAAGWGAPAHVQWLLKRGAVVDAADGDDWSPLHVACANGARRSVSILLAAGAKAGALTSKRESPLHLAAWHGQDSLVKGLVDRGSDINGQTLYNLRTPLQIASRAGFPRVVRALVRAGANLEATTKDGATALIVALAVKAEATAEVLISCGADVDALGRNDISPLMITAYQGLIGPTRSLIKKGADVNATGDDKNTPLHLAAISGYDDVADLLVAANADIEAEDYEGATPLVLAAAYGHEEVFESLVAANARIEATGRRQRTPLHQAAKNNHIDIVSRLLDKGADIHARDVDLCTPLHLAARRGHAGVIALLSSRGAALNVLNEAGNSPLHLSALRGHEQATEALLNAGGDIELRSGMLQTPLHCAAANGNEALTALLLARGANIAAYDKFEQAPFHLAAIKGHAAVLEQLIMPQIIDNPTASGYTALDFAVANGHAGAVDILFKRKARIDVVTRIGTALHKAADAGDATLARRLLDGGAARDKRDALGRTPLHLASRNGHDAVAAILAAENRYNHLRDLNGWTPLHTAVAFGHRPVIRTLLANGADFSSSSASTSALAIAIAYERDDIVEMMTTDTDLIEDKRSEAASFLKDPAASLWTIATAEELDIIDDHVPLMTERMTEAAPTHFKAWLLAIQRTVRAFGGVPDLQIERLKLLRRPIPNGESASDLAFLKLLSLRHRRKAIRRR